VLIAAFLGFTPTVWQWLEPIRLQPDHRLPYTLGNDYWTYGRLCRAACAEGKTLVVGDSVVWGHYVAKDQTLPAHLNRLAGADRFANLGLDGIHPAAMAGLVQYYGRAISGKKVILHCNPLWMSSKRHDLQETKEFAFNHPTLVPQFFPSIPCYRESWSDRLGIAIERRLPFHAWKKHLQLAYLGRSPQLGIGDVTNWGSFCEKLSDQRVAETPCPGRRIRELLPPHALEAVGEVARETDINERLTAREEAIREKKRRESRRAGIVRALSEIMTRRDLYREEDFGDIRLPAEAKGILKAGIEAISQARVQRLNRLLLEASYPGEIARALPVDKDLPTWTLEHPYESPLRAITLELPSPDETPSPEPVAEPWTRQGIARFNAPWVDLETSFQWRSFQRAVELLRSRGNRVFVLVGPFNEHMLKPESLQTYMSVKREAEKWLQKESIPYFIPAPLPSDLYADASHPLAEGYAALAKQLFENEAFAQFHRSAAIESGVEPPHSKAGEDAREEPKATGLGASSGFSRGRFGVRWLDTALDSQRSGETCEGPHPSWWRTR
jgi:hypothetical protein